MTKADIIESVYERVGFSKKESAEIVELVFDTLKESLEQGEKIKISGFGNFQVRDKKSRVGRNPHTGQELEIPARSVLRFRVSQVLKAALNAAPPFEGELPASEVSAAVPSTEAPSSSAPSPEGVANGPKSDVS